MWSRFFSPNVWHPDRDFIQTEIEAPPFHRLHLERFSKGIDNIRIDVVLDKNFIAAAIVLVETLVRENVQRYCWLSGSDSRNTEAEEVFSRLYSELTRVVVSEARTLACVERVQLFHLAVTKLLLSLVDQQLTILKKELDEAKAQPARQVSGQSLELHQKAVLLARSEETMRYRAVSDIKRIIMRLENAVLHKVRKSVLGSSWPVSQNMLNNPLMHMSASGTDEDFISHWPFMLRSDVAITASRCVFGLLDQWLPKDVDEGIDSRFSAEKQNPIQDASGFNAFVDIEKQVRSLIGARELDAALPHYFDRGEMVAALFGGVDGKLPHSGSWRDDRCEKSQQQLLIKLETKLKKSGLLALIEASYLLESVYRLFAVGDSVSLIFDYLSGQASRSDFIRQLENSLQVKQASAEVDRLDALVKDFRIKGRVARRNLCVRFVRDFIHYRYHLKLAYWMYQGMDDLRLLRDPRDKEMSQANLLLQEFTIEASTQIKHQRVIGHVIIKADVRGSTEITAEMRARKLNPAAYFSRNLYDPITAIAKEFGGKKIFVEGDAVILMLLEYEGGSQGHLAVARACGLARKILQVVDVKNIESAKLGLPELELGLGIAYSDEAPTYLYDEGHKITISPAINRTDRLSSCNARLRSLLTQKGENKRGIEVVESVSRHDSYPEGLLRYNVNGIELDAPAFYQLGVEIKLQSVNLGSSKDVLSKRYRIGRYPDVNGSTHWLVIRDATVRLLIGSELVAEDIEGRRFHEVITDPSVIVAVKNVVAGKKNVVDLDKHRPAS